VCRNYGSKQSVLLLVECGNRWGSVVQYQEQEEVVPLEVLEGFEVYRVEAAQVLTLASETWPNGRHHEAQATLSF
jgi:hypothetical protein